ncbi:MULTISPECIES: AMP-binding protein [unclassified Pseudomonas]|uniref:AMP-binding protein n=1 Tax=unclassified Pseudomonas TaxID=196821 RepID=UPI002304FA2E|nr:MULTISPECIES: AMP-binding protein [unclassified Pseudomonas]MDU9414316.1 AMP-binding protein [Pseudomonas sp. zfem005]WCD77990.1 AMP-binding protein [Pseudomonas sp. TUM22785]
MMQYDPLTLAGLIQLQVAANPDLTVLTIEGAGVRPDDTRTYAQLWELGQRLACGLRHLGLRPGDKLGTLLANHAEFVELMVAASLLGLVLVPIDPRTKGDKLIYMLGSVHCKAVVAGDYALTEVRAVRDRIASLNWLIGLPSDEGRSTSGQLHEINTIAYASLQESLEEVDAMPGAHPDSALELIYTSGTTGDPKGIVMTHRRYVETARMMPAVFGFRADDRLYSGLSLTHANAQLITLGTALANAIPCVLSRRFTKSRLWEIVRQYGCTSFTLLGGMITAIYAEPPKPEDSDNPVRLIVSAGMPAAIWEDFEHRFNVSLFEFYGAAEGGLIGNPAGVGPIGSIGKPVPSLDYRLVDDEGRDVEPDAKGERIGELLFRHKDGTPFNVEYYGNAEASTKKCAGGWLHMGDVVREDQAGWLYFMFRKGNGIRRNGDFINAAFIEKLIAEQPEVDDVFVYGIPSANGVPGEKDVVAAVVAKHRGLDVQGLFRTCRAGLEANFVPSHIQVLAQIPKTASEKPQERFLVEELQNNPQDVHQEQR